MAQIEYIGVGALKKLGDIFATVKPRRVLLVVGKQSYTASGAQSIVDAACKGLEVLRFDDFAPLPIQEDVERGTALCAQFAPDIVVAVGGGHVMDIAKAINFYTNKKPLVAVPTTAGSGSEATPFAVVYKDGVKTSLEDASILPTYAIVDSDLVRSVPQDIAVASALDALAQAIESCWAVGATDESRGYARDALQLVWKNITPAVKSHDPHALEFLCRGAHLAGKAIAISKTTACHALSYALTSRFGVPHGVAVAVFLPGMMRLNDVALPLPGVTPETVERLLQELGITKLSRFGVSVGDVTSLARGVDVQRLSNNPHALIEADIITLYTSVI